MMTEAEARALMARRVDVATAAALMAVPPELLAAVASGGAVTLSEGWRTVRRHLEARLFEVRAARRGAYMRARRACERLARTVVQPDRARAVLAAFAGAVARVLDALALTVAGLDTRLAQRVPGILRAVAEAAREAATFRALRKGKRGAR